MAWIENIIDRSIMAKAKANKRSGKFSFSKLGHCLRQIMMEERKYDELYPDKFIPNTPQQERVFAAGYLFERFCVDNTKDITVASQIPCEYRGIKGTADVVLDDAGKNVLGDWKSVHSDKFGYLSKEAKPDESYAMQITGYYLSLKDKYKLEDKGLVIYVEKNSILIKEMGFEFKDYIGKVNAKIDLYERACAVDTLPDGLPLSEEGKIPWQCFSNGAKNGCRLWCSYIRHCEKYNTEYLKAMEEEKKMKSEKAEKKAKADKKKGGLI